jgi:hypothetical protein
MAKCASCESKVEEGMVRCPSCGTNLARPGAFLQTLGVVTVALSTIPFAMSEVTSREGNQIPMVLGIAVLALGIVMIVSARMKNRAAPATIIEDAPAADAG